MGGSRRGRSSSDVSSVRTVNIGCLPPGSCCQREFGANARCSRPSRPVFLVRVPRKLREDSLRRCSRLRIVVRHVLERTRGERRGRLEHDGAAAAATRTGSRARALGPCLTPRRRRVAGAVHRLAWLVLQNRSEGGAMLSDGGRHEWSRLTVSDASSGARIGATAYV